MHYEIKKLSNENDICKDWDQKIFQMNCNKIKKISSPFVLRLIS